MISATLKYRMQYREKLVSSQYCHTTSRASVEFWPERQNHRRWLAKNFWGLNWIHSVAYSVRGPKGRERDGVLWEGQPATGLRNAVSSPIRNWIRCILAKKAGIWWLQISDIFTAQTCVYTCTNSFINALVCVGACVYEFVNKYSPTPSPRLCLHTAPTSKILADNGYKNSATNTTK